MYQPQGEMGLAGGHHAERAMGGRGAGGRGYLAAHAGLRAPPDCLGALQCQHRGRDRRRAAWSVECGARRRHWFQAVSWPVRSRNDSRAAGLIFRSFSGVGRNKGVPGVSHEEKHKRAGPERTKTDWESIEKHYRSGVQS